MDGKKATRVAYGETLVELGKKNDKIVVLDSDLAEATNTVKFKKAFPNRFFDCGIAEGNMIDMAAGLSAMGYIPFASTFAIFGAGRGYEHIRNGVAYSGLNVKLAFSHAGITVGEDGGSHQAIEDIALMRVIPGMTVIVPCDANETRKAVEAAAAMDGPVYLRLARLASNIMEDMPFEIGKANIIRDGIDVVLFTCGLMVDYCIKAAEELELQGVSVAVVNLHTIKPLDQTTVIQYALKCHKVLTVEEHSVIGGLGDAVAGVIAGKGTFKFKKLGVQDCFGESGRPDELLHKYGLSVDKIVQAVKEL